MTVSATKRVLQVFSIEVQRASLVQMHDKDSMSMHVKEQPGVVITFFYRPT